MFLVPINYLAILLCGVANMVLGFLWYGPIFGEKWMKLVGTSREKITEEQKKGMTKVYSVSFFLSLLTAYALAHFIWFTAPGNSSYLVGIKTALWVWIGFIATTMATGFLYSTKKKSWDLYLIESGYQLASLIVMGLIIVAWPAI